MAKEPKQEHRTVLDLFKMLAIDAALKGNAERLLRVLDVLELIWEDEEERSMFCKRLGEREL